MSLTYTPSGALGSKLPNFNLLSVDGKRFSAQDFKEAKALLVMFICNHCPYVKAIESRLLHLARDLKSKGLSTVAICSNDGEEYPEDSPTELFQTWKQKNYEFPYLVDQDQKAAQAFGAVCTPDLYVFNERQELAYRGRLDDSWRNEKLVQRQELREAIESILLGKPLKQEQNPSMGCSIKWKKGD